MVKMEVVKQIKVWYAIFNRIQRKQKCQQTLEWVNPSGTKPP